jgi:hypothetical protein
MSYFAGQFLVRRGYIQNRLPDSPLRRFELATKDGLSLEFSVFLLHQLKFLMTNHSDHLLALSELLRENEN